MKNSPNLLTGWRRDENSSLFHLSVRDPYPEKGSENGIRILVSVNEKIVFIVVEIPSENIKWVAVLKISWSAVFIACLNPQVTIKEFEKNVAEITLHISHINVHR